MNRLNKYKAQVTHINGRRFASQREAKRYVDLSMLERAGEIRDLKLQPKFQLTVNGEPVRIRSKRYPNGRKVTYIADFSYIETNSDLFVIEDAKGMDTPLSKLKRALVEAIYGVEVQLV